MTGPTPGDVPDAYAKVVLSYEDGLRTVLSSVTLHTEGVDLDEAVDALLAGLNATEGRTYTVDAAEIVESVRRKPVLPAVVRRPVPARPVKRRPAEDPRRPVTPADESPRVIPRA